MFTAIDNLNTIFVITEMITFITNFEYLAGILVHVFAFVYIQYV